jgi:hypothetical protein
MVWYWHLNKFLRKITTQIQGPLIHSWDKHKGKNSFWTDRRMDRQFFCGKFVRMRAPLRTHARYHNIKNKSWKLEEYVAPAQRNQMGVIGVVPHTTQLREHNYVSVHPF